MPVMDPVHKTPAEMNASGIPDNAIRSFVSENVMRMVPPAETGATELNVMPNGWQSVALDRHVGSVTAVTWYPEIGPVAPLFDAVESSVSVVVVTRIPTVVALSSPPNGAPRETPPNVNVIVVAAEIEVIPVKTKRPFVNDSSVYPVGAPDTVNDGWAAQEGVIVVATKNPVGQAMVMKFLAAAHPPAVVSTTAGTAVVVVNAITGATTVPAILLAKGMLIDTAVTAVGVVPIVRVSAQVMV